MSTLGSIVLEAVMLQATAESFQRREILSALVVAAMVWTLSLPGLRQSVSVETYIFASLSLSVFPLLPVEKGESIPIMSVAFRVLKICL